MAAVQSKVHRASVPDRAALTIADFVLIRVAAGGATRADLQRDLAAFFAPKVSGTVFRRGAELAIGNFTAQGLVSEVKGRLTITAGGLRSAEGLIAPIPVAKTAWETLRNHALLMRALLGQVFRQMRVARRHQHGRQALLFQRVLDAFDAKAKGGSAGVHRVFLGNLCDFILGVDCLGAGSEWHH